MVLAFFIQFGELLSTNLFRYMHVVKCRPLIFFLTAVILYEVLLSTVVIHCYLRKVAVVSVEEILFTFAEIFVV